MAPRSSTTILRSSTTPLVVARAPRTRVAASVTCKPPRDEGPAMPARLAIRQRLSHGNLKPVAPLLDMEYLQGTEVPQSADNWATSAPAGRVFPVSGTGSRRHDWRGTARIVRAGSPSYTHMHYMHPMRDGSILHGPTLFHHTKLCNNQLSGTSSIPSCR